MTLEISEDWQLYAIAVPKSDGMTEESAWEKKLAVVRSKGRPAPVLVKSETVTENGREYIVLRFMAPPQKP